MRKKLDLSVVIFLLIAAILGTYTITYMLLSGDWRALNRKNDAAIIKLVEAMDVIDSGFVGDYDEDELVDGAIRGMVSSLEDRWSYYMTAQELSEYYLDLKNQYSGIGIVIEKADETEGISIITVHKNSPAYKAGITPESVIVSVDGIDITDMQLSEASKLMNERIDTGSLNLGIIDTEGKQQTFELAPGVIEVDPVSYKLLEGNIGLVTISNFDAKSSSQLKSAVDNLIEKGAEGFVFDVRNNPGGLLSELLEILDYLLPEGTIFISKSKGEQPQIEKSGAGCIDMPMTVLVNSNSYSAAEFFAAALQEYDWAKVIGEKTTGKGYAQITAKLSDGSAIHISYSEYFTPNGNSLANKGIAPDIEVGLSEEKINMLYYGRLEPADDAQLQQAIEELNVEMG